MSEGISGRQLLITGSGSIIKLAAGGDGEGGRKEESINGEESASC